MKKVILAVIVVLVVGGGIKEAGAGGCCGSAMGKDMTEASKGPGSSGRDCRMLSEMMENQSHMADHEETVGPCGPLDPGNSEAENVRSEATPYEMAN